MSGEKLWDFRCVTNQSDLLDMNYILAAPIVADGVLYVSVTEELTDLSGRIFSIGNATTQQRGKVISNPIHVPKVKWWDKFGAVKGTGNITFSILDEHYNVLLDDVKDKGDISNSSIINTNVIRLCAKFSKEGSENPLLYSWSIIWKTNAPPVLDYDSFIPNSDGWINTNTPVCSINVYDAMPGLNVDSARYYITYVSDENNTVTTDWISANCSGTYGTRGNQTIVADISALYLSDDIAKLKSIKISIQDLAAYESTINVSFKIDMIKPTSNIKDVDSFSSKYNKSVIIMASASDPGDPDVNKSDVKNITLYHRLNGDEEWIKYGTDVESPYNWSFDVDTGGDYELCTIAADNAGNVEDYPSQGDVSFIYDTKEPYIRTEFATEYRSNKLPEFSIIFKDDFKLEKIEYSPNFETEWTEIEANISEDTYDSEWTLLQRHWDNMIEGVDYYIYFRITDICGNQYETPSDNESLKLIKDLTPSKSYLDLSDFQEWHWDNVFTITTNIPDDSSITNMELYYRYSPDKEEWSEWKRYGGNLTESPFKWKFTAKEGSGCYEFYTRVCAAGMVGESKVESVSVTVFPMIPIVIMISLVIILILVSAFISVKMKKKKA